MATEPAPRASPDALLARARKEDRGHLKIFLGAAPGVGKTYAMLTAARAESAGGRDVVAGLIETHGRRETEVLTEGLETLPRKSIIYRNQVLREFDLDAALKRRPGLLLVDEYAHSNVPGSRHPKRWQDIDELLKAGINVWSTLNIQHLESLNDVVQKITKVRVRETVPDMVFDKADEVVLVDFPAGELLKRLAEGKVYVQDTAARAVESFFKPQNLTALRELALRRAAERVDADLVERMQAEAIEGPWAAGERILACIGPDPISPAVIRTAKRLADLMDAPWIAVTVERPGVNPDEEARKRLDEAMALARSLGADTETLTGADIPAELLRFARFENVTQIVVGRSRNGFFNELLRRSLPHELVRRTQDIAIHLVTRDREADKPRWRWRLPPLNANATAFVSATALVAVATGIGTILTDLTTIPNLSIVYLLAVLLTAVRFGIWPAIYASVLSFGAYNFFFINPLYTFTIAEPYELLALAIFLLVAIITSAVAGRARYQAGVSASRMRAMRRLYEFTRRLSGLATPDAVAEGAASEMHISLARSIVVLLENHADLDLVAAWPPEDSLDAAAMTAARWAYQHNEPAGANTGTLPTIPWYFIPLRFGERMLGVVGVAREKDQRDLDSEALALLDTLAEQTASALDRAMLSREMVSAKTATEAERVRNTMLASISHDFRTPLSSILGSASSLLDYGERLDPAARNDLLQHIKVEAEGLDELVRNLLAVTRIDAGALELRRDWVDLREIVQRIVSAARRRGAAQSFTIGLSSDLPLIRADAALIEQAVGTVVANAVAHTPRETIITIESVITENEIELMISDNGPGIPAEALPRIFEKFVSLGAASSADGGHGTGLGLAIAKGIAEAHGGSVEAQSPVADGHGTRFILHLPRERAEP
ncbi:Sensor protein KdpD [Afipia felis]|uniref:histidine kinase n=1 Tax=Afipia felis TaxID=1035 RepID=A0A090MTS4_AFIFE|nr:MULTISPECIES: sensor histidine kinase KdpD [Afipia]EFI50931.1 osmosensitive K channel signal transduction histidine kinase [Afipia sp. 1NLS2]MBE0703324.1 sensor histidine kinase KdpD [Afipia sp.]CEG09617.1 Sensor protein KdpD [Afipia felis]